MATVEPVAQPPTATPIPPTAAPAPVAPTPLPANVSPFTGLEVANPELLRRRPIFICVNNDAVGRSAHYGLSLADLVYEYIVDGFTLTRITALFQSQNAERVGPVRSARLPNVWMTYMYDGVLACSGGSDEVRYLLKNEVGFPYLDADIDDPSQVLYFSSLGTDYRTRIQTSTDGVRRWLADKNLTKEWSRPGFQFNQEPPPNSAGARRRSEFLTRAATRSNGATIQIWAHISVFRAANSSSTSRPISPSWRRTWSRLWPPTS
ncbi:MAG: DUF3048 domain-containing protein [Caldilineaceae bacterium]|nr:DUF3048 domain-containing protein [Caldilineaceae bacterium]